MIQDFRFAFRQLIKAPGFAIAAVLMVVLGIGANTVDVWVLPARHYVPEDRHLLRQRLDRVSNGDRQIPAR